jgi:beta-glucosidase
MMEQTPDGASAYNMGKYPIPTDREWYAAHPEDKEYSREYPTYGEGRTDANNCAITLVSMMKDDDGKDIAYNDSAWDTFMDQLTFDEQVTLITIGQRCTAGLDSIAKPLTKDDNGPNGYNQVYRNGQNGLAYRSEVKAGHVDASGNLTDAADPDSLLKTTAMPSNGVIAATFNKDLAYRAGKIIGEDGIWAGESGIYGIGANLHRTSYQGRSAEYYSEDGILTGFAAGYECKGIEEKGVHVYNKHCALNEQEDTRHGLCTWASEQAVREEYLRPFEMCISIGNAYNVMASLNRFGTQAAPACGALGESYLRGECGMQGIIVTDMYTDMTGYRTIAPYFQMTYGVYYGGSDLPDGNNIKTPDGATDMFAKFAPDANGNGDYARMAWRIRECAKRVLYASCHSNAMNGLSSGTRIHQILTNWQVALITIDIVLA